MISSAFACEKPKRSSRLANTVRPAVLPAAMPDIVPSSAERMQSGYTRGGRPQADRPQADRPQQLDIPFSDVLSVEIAGRSA